jgi:hypothetical protein
MPTGCTGALRGFGFSAALREAVLERFDSLGT